MYSPQQQSYTSTLFQKRYFNSASWRHSYIFCGIFQKDRFILIVAVFIAGDELKTLADVAHSYADAPGPSSPNQDKPHKSLAEAAMAYQEHLSPPKSQPARVSVVTGEEEERNVLQVRIFLKGVKGKLFFSWQCYMFFSLYNVISFIWMRDSLIFLLPVWSYAFLFVALHFTE